MPRGDVVLALKLLKIAGPQKAAVIFPKTVRRLELEFAYRNANGHMGARYFF